MSSVYLERCYLAGGVYLYRVFPGRFPEKLHDDDMQDSDSETEVSLVFVTPQYLKYSCV